MHSSKFITTLFIVQLCAIGCNTAVEHTQQQVANQQFLEAKELFENNAINLQDIDFVTSAGIARTETRSDALPIISPLWKKTKVFTTKRFTIYEMPISGDIKAFAQITEHKDSLSTNTIKQVVCKLILKQDRTTKECIYYIATMIGKNENPEEKDINYTHNKSFTGFVFISNLEGRCVGIYKCQAGMRKQLSMNFVRKSSLKPTEPMGTTIQLYKPSAMSYSNGEIECVAGDCIRCLDYGIPCEECDFCYQYLDEATVTWCRKCGENKIFCRCCPICKNYPCDCYGQYACPYCHLYYCTGECRSICSFCGQRGCDGSCQFTGGNGGGGTVTPPKQEDDKCNDARCSKCGKCLNPSKSTCSKCTCCTHEICKSCGKPIRPIVTTKAGYNCSHAENEYCSSTGEVCPCGERHIDETTGVPKCRKLIGTLLDNIGNAAYSDMWDWSVTYGKECAGCILQNGKILVYFYRKNTPIKSSIGEVFVCHYNNKEYLIPNDSNVGQDSVEEILSYNIINVAHTHLAQHVLFDSIKNDQIKAHYLSVSQDDINQLLKFKHNSGLILSKKEKGTSKGFVFKYDAKSLDTNGYCPIVDYFD